MGDLSLEEIRNQCLQSLYSCTENIAKYLDTEKADQYNKLRTCVKNYCKLDLQNTASQLALQAIQDESDLNTLESRYKEEVAKHTNVRVDIKKHPYHVNLEKHIREAEHVTDAEEDTDIAVTETQETYIDPITKRRITNPVKNSICNHIYEKEAIENYLQNRAKKCPYSGCRNIQKIEKQHLVPDEELRQILASTAQEESESQ